MKSRLLSSRLTPPTMPKAKEQKGAEEQVARGGGGMPAFEGTLSEEEIGNVAVYMVETIVGK
ncbi:MAG TPA: cytochrome c [Solirubrobacterales bacterium]|nr:cytochrome c [Solirubrobacterales bacterium]